VVDRNRHITDQVFDYYRCPSCQVVFLAPIPENLSDYYQDEYYALPVTVDDLQPSLPDQRYKIDLLRPFKPGGSLLEIGPAAGSFAYLALQAGYHVEVIEMDQACCKFISEKLSIRAICSADPASALDDLGQYDVIALWHVIEHLPSPWDVLPALADHLSPGGILVIAAPNPRAFQFRILRQFWTHLDAPRHLELIPADTLKASLNQVGLKSVFETTTDRGGLGWNTFGWKISLHNLVKDQSLKRLMRGMGLVLTLVFAPIERNDMFGSAYTLVFQKGAK